MAPYEYEASGGIPGVLVRKLGSKTVLREMPHRIGAVPHPPGGVPRRASWPYNRRHFSYLVVVQADRALDHGGPPL